MKHPRCHYTAGVNAHGQCRECGKRHGYAAFLDGQNQVERERDALLAALADMEHQVGMACVEINTPTIGKVTAAQWFRVERALEAARALLSTLGGEAGGKGGA